jgi:ribulose-5-phosphate 4-epimerase/fuculose-1-phosphate aldolase
VVIKLSGIGDDEMRVDDIVIVNLDGKTMEGSPKPSSETHPVSF